MNFLALNMFTNSGECYSTCTDINDNMFASFPTLNLITFDQYSSIATEFQPYGLISVNNYLFVCDTINNMVWCYNNGSFIANIVTIEGPMRICSDWTGDLTLTTFNLYITHVNTNIISYVTFDTVNFFTNLSTYDTTISGESSSQMLDIVCRHYNSYTYLYLTTGFTYIKQIDITNLSLLNPLIPYTINTALSCSIISNTIQYYNNNFFIANSTDGIYMQSSSYNSNTGLILSLNASILIIAGGSTNIANNEMATASGQQASCLGLSYFVFPFGMTMFIGTTEGNLVALLINNVFYASIIYSGSGGVEYPATDNNFNVYGSIPNDNNKIVQITNDGYEPTSQTDIITGLPWSPRGFVIINNNIFISDNTEGNVIWFDLNNFENYHILSVGGSPHGMCTDWDGSSNYCHLYVGNEQLSLISIIIIENLTNIPSSMSLYTNINIEGVTEGVAFRTFNGNNYLYATQGNSSNNILQINLQDYSISQLSFDVNVAWGIVIFDETFYIGSGVGGGIYQYTIKNYNFGTGLIYTLNSSILVLQSGDSPTTITNGLVSTDPTQYISALGMSYNYDMNGLNIYVGSTDGYIVKLSYSNNYSCFGYNTDVIMADLSSKRICDIKENDEILEDIITNKTSKVAKVSKQFVKNYGYKLEKYLIGNTKDIYCTNHPIWCNNGKNRIFPSDIQGSERVQIKEFMYDILFENEGTFYANNIKVDSLPPLKDYKYDGEDDPIRQKPKMTFLFDGIDKFE